MSGDRAGRGAAGSERRSDSELARLASEGAQDALEGLLGRHGQDLFQFCCALAGAGSGEELLDRTFKRAAGALRFGTSGRAVRPWLFEQAHKEVAGLGPPAPERRRGGALRRFQELSQTERGGLVMRELSGFTYGAIADALGISSASLRQDVADARAAVVGVVPSPTQECKIVQKALLRDDLPASGRRVAERHIEHCPYCTRMRDGVAAVPELLKRALPKLAPVVLTALIREAVAHAAVGTPGDGTGRETDADAAARRRYYRRRSIAAGAVLALLVIVTALAVSTGRLNPDSLSGPSVNGSFTLPPAFFHLPRPRGPSHRKATPPFNCGAASCPPPLTIHCPAGTVEPDCHKPLPHRCPPGTVEPLCTPVPHPCPPGTVEPDCHRPRRCPNGTVEPYCHVPRRCPAGTVEPHCRRPHRCPNGTVEPDCHVPRPPCPNGTIEPDCHVPRPPCPNGTIEPDCHVPRPPCPSGTIEPDCQVPPRPCPDGTLEPDCRQPPPPRPCQPGTTGPDCHPIHDCPGWQHDCGHDLQPLPSLCDHHHGHHARPQPHATTETAPTADPPPDPAPVKPAPTPPADAPPDGAAPPSQAAATPSQPDPQPSRLDPQPSRPTAGQTPPQADTPPPADTPSPPQTADPPAPAPPSEPAPSEQPPPQPQPDQEHGPPPDRHHHDGGVQAQWAVEARARNRSRRFSIL